LKVRQEKKKKKQKNQRKKTTRRPSFPLSAPRKHEIDETDG
jgi:hypothetical protein